MQFRKKPLIIEAVQLPLGSADVPGWLLAALCLKGDAIGRAFFEGERLMIWTLEGMMAANPGDWIIRGVNGELHPCKADIFEKTYERVP